MKANSRLTAVLLLFTIVAAVPAVLALELPPRAAEKPARCHDSIPANPSPAPANHQCCAGGHDWAVTVSVLVLHPGIEEARTCTQTNDYQPSLLEDLPLAFVSDSPPTSATSLRI
jgi:hypothetical protein